MKNTLKLTLTLGMLVCALVLASCQSLLEPPASPETSVEESTAKAEVTVEPVDTAEPGETAAPADTTEPGETATPADTAEPGETTEPETTEPELNIPKQPLSNLVSGGTVVKPHSPDEYIYSNTLGDYRNHLGIDVAVSPDSEVYALYDGTVSKIWEDVMLGHCLAVDHGNGLMSFYKNLSGSYPAEVKEGATVKAGQVLGNVGDSAMIEIAEEPHLHFEMTLNDQQVDPADYLEGAQMPQPEEPETAEPTPNDPTISFDKQPLTNLVSGGTVVKPHSPDDPIYSNTMLDYRTHLGIDVAAASYSEVYALYDGTVENIWEDVMLGHCLTVNHGNGLRSTYKNLFGSYPAGVEIGATVKAGQAVGYVGDSAMMEIADEPHLHFEMSLDGETVDPADYLEGVKTPAPDEPEQPTPNDPTISFDKQPLASLVSGGKVVKPHSPDEYIYSNTMGDYRNHLGIDVAVSPDSEVYALYDGTVENIWEDVMLGHCLTVNHGNGLVSVYKNLTGSYPAGVEIGATVKAGQAVGYVGDSAMMEIADEPHLHFEMTLNGEQVDPLDYLNE